MIPICLPLIQNYSLSKNSKKLKDFLSTCRFPLILQYVKWIGSSQHPGILDIAADLTLHILVQCATTFTETPLSTTIYKETGITPYSDAAKTLRSLLCNNAKHFLSNKAIAALGGMYCKNQKRLLSRQIFRANNSSVIFLLSQLDGRLHLPRAIEVQTF